MHLNKAEEIHFNKTDWVTKIGFNHTRLFWQHCPPKEDLDPSFLYVLDVAKSSEHYKKELVANETLKFTSINLTDSLVNLNSCYKKVMADTEPRK